MEELEASEQLKGAFDGTSVYISRGCRFIAPNNMRIWFTGTSCAIQDTEGKWATHTNVETEEEYLVSAGSTCHIMIGWIRCAWDGKETG